MGGQFRTAEESAPAKAIHRRKQRALGTELSRNEPCFRSASCRLRTLDCDREQEYFSDGITRRHYYRSDQVSALTSSRATGVYLQNNRSMWGRRRRNSRVSHVLEGSVRNSAFACVITAQLSMHRMTAISGLKLYTEI